jgi:hypothetical protein
LDSLRARMTVEDMGGSSKERERAMKVRLGRG